MGKLRIIEDRATIVFNFIDTSFSSLTIVGHWMNISVLIQKTLSFLNLITTYTANTITRQKINEMTFSSIFQNITNNYTIDTIDTISAIHAINATNKTIPLPTLVNGQTRDYDQNIQLEMYLTTTVLSLFIIVVVLVLWCVSYITLRIRVICMIRKLLDERERLRPKAMTSKVIIETTKTATTAAGKTTIYSYVYFFYFELICFFFSFFLPFNCSIKKT